MIVEVVVMVMMVVTAVMVKVVAIETVMIVMVVPGEGYNAPTITIKDRKPMSEQVIRSVRISSHSCQPRHCGRANSHVATLCSSLSHT
ncbi:hypothetical protein E2C01_010357 [Portunus trituberculatus]|uniref:Uncharacterized protein n=1 Tax=Portunus trituberculatus TaxID=210409 RepID=A0A5B7D877_PORTR|nr:hypothetical protein [Portunus trituberculatus]